MFSPEAIEAMRQHAIDEYPREACGLVIDGVYRRYTNVHPDPENHFRIHRNAMVAAHKRGKVEALVHSHPDGPFYPSQADMEGQQRMGIPWGIIYSRPDSASIPVWFGDDVPIAPLVGRTFIHGVYDCFSLVRDYYREKLDIVLMDKPREDDWWSKPEFNQNFYLKYYEEGGFVKLADGEDLQEHDVILMAIMSDTPNHAAVYLGGDTMLHHLAARLSCEEVGVMKWRRHIRGFFRHKSLIKNEERE